MVYTGMQLKDTSINPPPPPLKKPKHHSIKKKNAL